MSNLQMQLLMGNEAIALGALRAGVQVVTGYPGTPSTEVLETIAKQADPGVYVEWSVNEKTALEVASGAAIAGARAMVTMKQVGLNVASDPLMSLNYVGVKGGLVLVVADDPGPISSQTEQDTRHFGRYAKLAVFDPSSPEEAYTMIADAFDCSERIGRPVILRPTTRVCHSYASVQLLDRLPIKTPEGYTKDNGRWVIFPRLAYANHIKIEAQLQELSKEFSRYAGNQLTGSGAKGIACGGVSYAYVKEALALLNLDCKLLKIATTPFPALLGEEFLQGLEEALVIEELDPVIETSLIALNSAAKIKGKLTGDMHNAGENTVASVAKAICKFLTGEDLAQAEPELPPLPIRPPVLCAGCPHRASFFAVKEAAKGRKAVYSGDIGCYTLGNAPPLDMVDTCLCMGAGIAQAQGLHRVEPDTLHFAFIGDSTFFHTGVPGIVNAVYNQTDIIVVILDNATTAMTGNQPHPGIGKTVSGQIVDKISIYEIVKAIGVAALVRVNAFDLPEVIAAAKSVLDKPGVRVLLLDGPCIAIDKIKKPPLKIEEATCTGCNLCVKKLGCPAISLSGGKAVIDSALCTGCGICTSVCPFRAIGGTAE